MAPIKFDDNIKDKLEKRSLQPSTDAWDTLSNRLDANDKKKSRSLFFYIGIAASIVGVLFVTTLLFNSSEDKFESPKVVDIEIEENQDELKTPEKVVVTSIDNNIQKKENPKEFIPQESSSIKNEPKIAQISEENKTIVKKEKVIINDFKMETVVVVIDTNASIKKEAVALNKLTSEQAKLLDVINKIELLNADGIAATDQEIEDLLKQAEKDILRQRIYNETIRTVDADALLQDVEQDLEQSFRTKVFEILKTKYKTVKTAVAERNN